MEPRGGLLFRWYEDDDVRTITVLNQGSGDLHWSITPAGPDAPWLTISPLSGTNETVLTVSIDRTGLADGGYQGTYQLTSNGGEFYIYIILGVRTVPQLSVSNRPIQFDFMGGTRRFTVGNSGPPTLTWTVSSNASWITLEPQSGTERGEVIVEMDPNNMPDGYRAGTITIDSNAGSHEIDVSYDPTRPTVNGRLGVYADVNGIQCNITDDEVGLLSLYVVQTATTGASGAAFSAPLPACMTGAAWIGDTKPFGVSLGDSQTGLSVGYGACMTGPIHVATINLFASGTSASCCALTVVAHPSWEDIHTLDCDSNLRFGQGLTSFVNGDATCSCMSLARVEETTWGKVKAMYQTEPEPASTQRGKR